MNNRFRSSLKKKKNKLLTLSNKDMHCVLGQYTQTRLTKGLIYTKALRFLN